MRQLNPKCGEPSHILLITIVTILLSVPLDAFHDKSRIKKGLCSRTFYVGDYKLIVQGVLGQSYYRNPINTEVSAVVMLHHNALLADHANGRIRRERVFRDHNDLLVHKNMYLLSRVRRTKLLLGPPSHPQVSPLQPP